MLWLGIRGRYRVIAQSAVASAASGHAVRARQGWGAPTRDRPAVKITPERRGDWHARQRVSRWSGNRARTKCGRAPVRTRHSGRSPTPGVRRIIGRPDTGSEPRTANRHRCTRRRACVTAQSAAAAADRRSRRRLARPAARVRSTRTARAAGPSACRPESAARSRARRGSPDTRG